MFPLIKAKSQQKYGNKAKEGNQWDERFVLHSMPEYSPLKDKHTKGYLKSVKANSLMSSKNPEIRRNKSQQVLISSRASSGKQDPYASKKQQAIQQIRSRCQQCQEELGNLQKLFNEESVPEFYQFYTLKTWAVAVDTDEYKQLILKEVKSIRSKNSHYHLMNGARKARTRFLQKLYKELKVLKFQEVLNRKMDIIQLVEALRMLTVNLIESVKKWRDHLNGEQLNPEDRPRFMINDGSQNVLMNLLNDSKFILTSVLSACISMGTKNDPFLLSAIKKALDKEQSEYLELFLPKKPIAYYQKYMEYLARQKAYQLRLQTSPTEIPIHSRIQNIYCQSPNSSNRKLKKRSQSINEKQVPEYVEIERIKQRMARINKNQQRINLIKNVYERSKDNKKDKSKKGNISTISVDKYLKEKSIGGQQIKIDKMKRVLEQEEDEFEDLVHGSYRVLTDESKGKGKKVLKVKQAPTKGEEEQLIQNVKDMDKNLKLKLKEMSEQNYEDHLSRSNSNSNSKFTNKNQKQIMDQLKRQIITKIEAEQSQRKILRQKKKESEEKMLEQLRVSMKKQLEEKLNEKKQQKLKEKQMLKVQLEEEEERLRREKQLEAQMKMKLSKERELRSIERVKKQAVERENMLREKLMEEQELRRERQAAIAIEKQEKEKLRRELQILQIKKELQIAVRQQLNRSHQPQRKQPQVIQQQISASLQIKEIKPEQEIIRKDQTHQESTTEMKQKQQQSHHKLKVDLQMMKHRQQKQMELIGKQNELRMRMLKYKKNEFEDNEKQIGELKKNIYSKLDGEEGVSVKVREEMEEESANQAEINRIKRQKQIEEEVFKEKIREKVEKELRAEAVRRTKRQIEQRQQKEYEKKKQGSFPTVNQSIIVKQTSQQNAKSSLRSLFEKQLFYSASPEKFSEKDTFKLKHTEHYLQNQHLDSRLQHPAKYQKPSLEHSPLKKSQVREHIYDLTQEQLSVYKKQKKSNKKDEEKETVAKQQFEHKGYQLLKVQQKNIDSEVEYKKKVIKNEATKDNKSQKSDNSKHLQSGSKKQNKKNKSIKNPNKKQSLSSEIDSEDDQKVRNMKKRKIKIESHNEDDSGDENRNKKIKVVNYETQKQGPIKKHKPQPQKDSQEEPMKVKSNQYDRNISITKIPSANLKRESRFEISVDAIPEAELHYYIQSHMNLLPIEQTQIIVQDHQELYRQLVSELTFSLLLGYYENQQIGVAFAFHDRKWSQYRKFVLAHIGTYSNGNLRQFIIGAIQYIFLKDPCDEIEFTYQFNENEDEQARLGHQMGKWFAKYGNVYQKKLDQKVFQRKFTVKRQYNHKCEVTVSGVNKNIFQNIFSVNSSVLLSNAPLIKVREELENDDYQLEDTLSYAIMIAELFRSYMTPDEAESLKKKVKEIPKLKELLIIVVMMQKKKIKMEELKLSQFKSLVELNMKLMSQGKSAVRCVKDSGVENNEIFYCQLSYGFNLPFGFQKTALPVEIGGENRQVSYFRLNPLIGYKLHLVKSALYSSEMNLFPTENSKLKLFVINGQEYLDMKSNPQSQGHSNLDLFMYIRIFMKNVQSYNLAKWKYIWMPEMQVERKAWPVRQFSSFYAKDVYVHDAINLSYREFLPSGLIISPQHRDLVLTPPFIIGIFSMTLQQVSQGCPLYARLVDGECLRTLEVQ